MFIPPKCSLDCPLPVLLPVTLPVESFQSEVADDAPADVAVKRLVERGPDMFMDQMGERGTRDRALEDSVHQAEQRGLRADGACRLRDILSRRVDAFCRALRGDPPARVEPMRVHLKPQAQAVKARPRRYDPVKTGWLASCIAALVAFGLLVRNIQAVCCLLYTSPSPRDKRQSRMPSSA